MISNEFVREEHKYRGAQLKRLYPDRATEAKKPVVTRRGIRGWALKVRKAWSV